MTYICCRVIVGHCGLTDWLWYLLRGITGVLHFLSFSFLDLVENFLKQVKAHLPAGCTNASVLGFTLLSKIQDWDSKSLEWLVCTNTTQLLFLKCWTVPPIFGHGPAGPLAGQWPVCSSDQASLQVLTSWPCPPRFYTGVFSSTHIGTALTLVCGALHFGSFNVSFCDGDKDSFCLCLFLQRCPARLLPSLAPSSSLFASFCWLLFF